MCNNEVDARIFAKPSLLKIDDADARSLAEIKRRHATECTSCTFCGYEFSLTSKLVTDLLPRHPWRFCPSSAFANSGGRYKEVGKKVPQAYLRYVEDCFLRSNAVDGMHIFKRLFVLAVISCLHILKNCRQLELIQIL